ncbi:MAG: hypothetical protein IJS17_05690, partial [Clostridia bacterium]|nr:hypothetical protein [Clostridia bacterium]
SGNTVYYAQANVPNGTNKVTYNNTISKSSLRSKVESKLTHSGATTKGWVAHCKNGVTGSTSTTPKVTSFNVNFRMKSGAYTNAYSAVNGSKVGRVYPNDICTIKTIYSNGWMKLVCPWNNSGNKTVYVKITEFKFKATKYINAYNGVNGSYVGRVYPNDLVSVQAIYSSGWMKCSCPWNGKGNKIIYIKTSQIY